MLTTQRIYGNRYICVLFGLSHQTDRKLVFVSRLSLFWHTLCSYADLPIIVYFEFITIIFGALNPTTTIKTTRGRTTTQFFSALQLFSSLNWSSFRFCKHRVFCLLYFSFAYAHNRTPRSRNLFNLFKTERNKTLQQFSCTRPM